MSSELFEMAEAFERRVGWGDCLRLAAREGNKLNTGSWGGTRNALTLATLSHAFSVKMQARCPRSQQREDADEGVRAPSVKRRTRYHEQLHE
jgi:hypothetical protein